MEQLKQKAVIPVTRLAKSKKSKWKFGKPINFAKK